MGQGASAPAISMNRLQDLPKSKLLVSLLLTLAVGCEASLETPPPASTSIARATTAAPTVWDAGTWLQPVMQTPQLRSKIPAGLDVLRVAYFRTGPGVPQIDGETQVRLRLFPDVDVTLETLHVTIRGLNRWSWVGQPRSDRIARAYAAYRGGRVRGSAVLDGHHLRLISVGTDVLAVVEVRPPVKLGCGTSGGAS